MNSKPPNGRVRPKPMPTASASSAISRRAGVKPSRYCGLYRSWLKRQAVGLRHEHRACKKLSLYYASDSIPSHNAATSEGRTAAIFVAVLGTSSYSYAEATWTQGLADWI